MLKYHQLDTFRLRRRLVVFVHQAACFGFKPFSESPDIGTEVIGDMGVAMGNYYFTPAEGGDDVKVEYSFAYTFNSEGKLKIVLHDSHLPYNPVT